MLNSSQLDGLPWPQGVNTLTFGYDTPAMVATLYSNGQSEQGFGVLQMANTDPAVPGAGPILHLPDNLDINAFRTALLAVPNLLPQQTMDQIKNVSNWETTLIIPVPENAVTTNVTVKGNAGLLIVDGQGRGSLLIWQSNGKLVRRWRHDQRRRGPGNCQQPHQCALTSSLPFPSLSRRVSGSPLALHFCLACCRAGRNHVCAIRVTQHDGAVCLAGWSDDEHQ